MELVGYGGLCLSVGVTLGQMLKNYSMLDSKYNQLITTPVLSPSSFLDSLDKSTASASTVAASLHSQYKSNPNGAGGSPAATTSTIGTSSTALATFFLRKSCVFLEGILTSNSPVKSISSPNQDLLCSLSYKKDLYSRQEFSTKVMAEALLLKSDEKHLFKVARSFTLQDFESPQNTCHIPTTSNLNFKDALEVIKMKQYLVSRNPIQQIYQFLLDVVSMIQAISKPESVNDDSNSKVQKTLEGVMDIELGIKLNSVVTVFGDVIYDIRNNRLSMENPKYILRDKSQLLTLLKKKLRFRRILIFFLVIILFVGGSMFFKRLTDQVTRLFNLKKQRILQAMRARMTEIANEKQTSEHQKCIVCFSNLRNIILKPCMHFSICHFCLQQLPKPQCPTCKSEILTTVEIVLK